MQSKELGGGGEEEKINKSRINIAVEKRFRIITNADEGLGNNIKIDNKEVGFGNGKGVELV